MARKKSDITIRVPANNGYYGLPAKYYDLSISNENELESQRALNRLICGEHSSFIVNDFASLKNDGYHNINTISFRKFSVFSEPRTIYEVRKANGSYYLNTGLYIGYLNVDGIRIEINTGYPDCLLKRMLNVANNIFFDSSFQENVKENEINSMLSVILEYLFLTNFKIAFALGLPSKYKRFNEKGLNIKGNLDIKKYLLEDMIFGSSVSYVYNQRVFSQDIIDVLYLAMKSMDSSNEKCSMIVGDYARYYRQLKQLYSGKRVSRATIRNIEKDKALNNPMYSKYKRVLKYAQYILEFKNLIYEDESNESGAPGFLLDISELWEIYLAKIIANRFSNYSVNSQEELKLYENTFFKRPNYPDIVMESPENIVVIDAKFKRMDFHNSDVDRNDLHQVHSYAGYYQTEARKPVKLCSLVYPVEDETNVGGKQIGDNLYGIEYAPTKFSIGYLLVGKTYQEMVKNENEFLDRLASDIA